MYLDARDTFLMHEKCQKHTDINISIFQHWTHQNSVFPFLMHQKSGSFDHQKSVCFDASKPQTPLYFDSLN